MPAEYTTFIKLYDTFMFWSIVVGTIVFAWMLYAVLRFREGMVDESKLERLEPGVFPKERDDFRLEMAWFIIPTILIAYLCIVSWNSLYEDWGNSPSDEEAFVVEAIATQWNWEFKYTEPIIVEESSEGLLYPVNIGVSDGRIAVTTGSAQINLTVKWSNEPASGEFNITDGEGHVDTIIDLQEILEITVKDEDGNVVHEFTRYAAGTGESSQVYVPCGEQIKFKMTSERVGDADAVLHAFFLPEWAVKEDVVPNLETMLYFTPQETGTYDVVCAEYCGMKHAYMTAQITVVPSSICGGDA